MVKRFSNSENFDHDKVIQASIGRWWACTGKFSKILCSTLNTDKAEEQIEGNKPLDSDFNPLTISSWIQGMVPQKPRSFRSSKEKLGNVSFWFERRAEWTGKKRKVDVSAMYDWDQKQKWHCNCKWNFICAIWMVFESKISRHPKSGEVTELLVPSKQCILLFRICKKILGSPRRDRRSSRRLLNGSHAAQNSTKQQRDWTVRAASATNPPD